jgi:hypothetical protein
MAIEAPKPMKLFYCYARVDKDYRDELDNHLSNLKRSHQITSWSDREISPGVEWKTAIDKELNTAHIILLLVSSSFMASDYCYGIEMKRALDRHAAGEVRVVPILLRAVDWEDAPFSNLQVLPSDAKPISRWSDRDDAFEDIAKGLRKVVKELQTSLEAKQQRLDEIQKRIAQNADQPTVPLVQVQRPSPPPERIWVFPREQSIEAPRIQTFSAKDISSVASSTKSILCSLGHTNPAGSVFCDECGEPL